MSDVSQNILKVHHEYYFIIGFRHSFPQLSHYANGSVH